MDKDFLKYHICRQDESMTIKKAVEELIELSNVLMQYENKGNLNIKELITEIADVEIITQELKYLFDITEKSLKDEIKVKIDRVKKQYNRYIKEG